MKTSLNPLIGTASPGELLVYRALLFGKFPRFWFFGVIFFHSRLAAAEQDIIIEGFRAQRGVIRSISIRSAVILLSWWDCVSCYAMIAITSLIPWDKDKMRPHLESITCRDDDWSTPQLVNQNLLTYTHSALLKCASSYCGRPKCSTVLHSILCQNLIRAIHVNHSHSGLARLPFHALPHISSTVERLSIANYVQN